MASNEPIRNHIISPAIRGSLSLFPAEQKPISSPRVERYARICTELLHVPRIWIDAPGRFSARIPAVMRPNDTSAELSDLLGELFPGGMPRELTILPDIKLIDKIPLHVGTVRFLIASPLVTSGNTVLGVLCAVDHKPRKLTAKQIDSFKELTILIAEEAEQTQKLEIRSLGTDHALPSLSEEFLQSCPSPAWLIDVTNDNFIGVNNAAVNVFGFPREDFLMSKASSLLGDEPLIDAQNQVSAAKQITFRAKDGNYVDSEIIGIDVLFDGHHARLELLRDVTKWRRIEDRSRFQTSVLRQISDAVIAVDLNHRITYWNHVAEQMYEYKSGDVLGEKLPDLLQPIWKDEHTEKEATMSLFNLGQWTGDTIHHRRSGEMLYVESSVTAIKNNENRQVGFLCLNRDITERKKMEKTLLESEQRYRSLFDFHPDSVVWIDLDGKFLSANLACRNIFGYTPDELVGKSLLPLVDPQDRVMVLDYLQRGIHGEPVSFEYTGLHKNGRAINLATVILPVIVDGRIVGVYSISQDIGERKRLQSVIKGENEVLQWLAANKPLNTVVDHLITHIEKRYDAVRFTVSIFKEDMSLESVIAPGMAIGSRKILSNLKKVLPKTTVGRCLELKQRVDSISIATDPDAIEQRDIAKGSSMKAASSTPIIGNSGLLLGAITIYFKTERAPSPEEINIVDRTATLLRIAIESDRAYVKLSLNERAMDSTVASVVIIDPREPNRPIIYANKAFERITGYRKEDVIGRSTSILHGSETDTVQLKEIELAIKHERECNVLIKYYTSEGKPYWSSSSMSPVRDNEGKLTHFIEVQNDVTPLMEALDAVRESEQRFRQLIENASDIVIVLEESGAIRYISPAVERILGYRTDEVRGKSIFELIHPDDLVFSRKYFLELVENPEQLSTIELRSLRKDGSWCHVEATGQNLIQKPGVRGIVVHARDLSERKQADDRLDHLAYHDVLTDLPNRLLFNDHLNKAIAIAKRRAGVVAVLFLDLDRFKVINDTLGHSVGDGLLQQVGRRLVISAREGDTVARWGGDEFTVILSTISSSRDAARAATRIINSLSEPFQVAGHELYITATVGISMFPAAGDDAEMLIRNADTAMYRAKQEGQNHYQFYTPKMNAGAGERLALEGRLRRALDREEFVLYYQPQVNSKTGRIVGAEALVRWQHPELGLVPPKDFIPLSEETGLIVPIGEWIMNQACKRVRLWQDQGFGPLKIAVNLSARQFSQRDLQPMILKMLKDTGADPTWLELELTESMLINSENRVINAMKELAAIGLSLTIDDFGVGYSSYSYLKRYPVSALKIEQSFIRGMLTDAHDNAIVQSVIAMAHKLDLRVIAEGIETKEQAAALIASQCDFLQGYYYGKPAPAEEFIRLITKQQLSEVSTR